MRLVMRVVAISLGMGLLLLPGGVQGDTARDDHQTHNSDIAAPVFVQSIGGPGTGSGEFSDPWHSAVNSEGRIIVADAGNDRIQIFDDRGRFLFAFGSTGSGDGQLSDPRGVAVGPENRIVVADTGNHRLQSFTADGVFEWAAGSRGSEPGQLESPTGVHVAESGEILVADTGNHRVETFDANGSHISTLGSFGIGDGELRAPSDVTIGPRGRTYVVEQTGGRVSVFDTDLAFMRHLGSPGAGPEELSGPTSVFIDDHEMVYVTDTGNGRVQTFAMSSTDGYWYRWSFAEPDAMSSPRAITIDAAGKALVVDPAGNRLERWKYFRCMGRRATLVGTPGPDRFFSETFGRRVIVGRGGDDSFFQHFGSDFLCGGAGDDEFYGGWNGDSIQGGPGRDFIDGGKGADDLRGGRGRDRIFGRDGADLIHGGLGDDVLFGGDKEDQLFGGAGDDRLRGGQGPDSFSGGAGTDRCEGGRGGLSTFVGCEEELDRQAPEGWYQVRDLAAAQCAGFLRPETYCSVWFAGIDLDEGTGLLWGADRLGDWVGAFNHTGDLVAEYDVGGDAALAGGPITVQVHGGEVYILGSDNERIVVMGTDGSPRRHWGGPGTEPGKFEDLCDVVVTDNYVLTAERAGRYQVFDHSGNHLREFTSVVDSDCAVSVFNDEIYSISSDRGIVVVLDMDGELLREFGEGVLFQPIAIEVSASGLVWVGGHHENIHAMTPSGDVVETISGFEVLHALTVDGSDHALWTFHHRRHRNGGRGTNHVDVFTDLSCGGRRIEVLGTAYGDVIALGETHDIVHAGGGDDTVAAGPGPDYVCGGDGADDLAGGFGDDFLYGGDGLDTLRGGPGEDFCDGGEADVTFGCELPGG